MQLELALPEQLLVLVVVDWPGRLRRQLVVVEQQLGARLRVGWLLAGLAVDVVQLAGRHAESERLVIELVWVRNDRWPDFGWLGLSDRG